MRIVSNYEESIIRVKMWRDGKKKEVEDLLDALILAKDSNGEPTLSVEETKAQITANYIPCLKALYLDGHEKMVSEAMSRTGR
ncbi:hypothetical protein FH972_014865 [Carpinus fangiana]|uniref:Uncharacterized protein n=1 Tax=Carpinus fangiana TaxID=176857 RepID=A0A5N6REM8_9ROSI|nr:hypothetical protein FH972_014865 [Carpinus fangiana]